MKLIYILLSLMSLSGCITKIDQPLEYSYEGYYKHKKSDISTDNVKADMKSCGFESLFNNMNMLQKDRDSYIKSQLCMEHKGYKDNSLPQGVCHRYSDSPICK